MRAGRQGPACRELACTSEPARKELECRKADRRAMANTEPACTTAAHCTTLARLAREYTKVRRPAPANRAPDCTALNCRAPEYRQGPLAQACNSAHQTAADYKAPGCRRWVIRGRIVRRGRLARRHRHVGRRRRRNL